MSVVEAVFPEDGDFTLLARVTARNGSGAATGVDGEGNFIQQADVSSITRHVFDLSSDTPDTDLDGSTVTVANAILDTVVTSSVLWTKDSTGYNFIDDVPANLLTNGNHNYWIEYKVTLSGGAVVWAQFTGPAQGVRQS